MKKVNSNKQSHTSNTKKGTGDWHVSHSSMGMGDYYGSGIRAKIGKVKEDSINGGAISPKSLNTPPRGLA